MNAKIVSLLCLMIPLFTHQTALSNEQDHLEACYKQYSSLIEEAVGINQAQQDELFDKYKANRRPIVRDLARQIIEQTNSPASMKFFNIIMTSPESLTHLRLNQRKYMDQTFGLKKLLSCALQYGKVAIEDMQKDLENEDTISLDCIRKEALMVAFAAADISISVVGIEQIENEIIKALSTPETH